MDSKIELNHIYNMDCTEGMKLLPDNSIDLTVTSPPYDNLRNYNGYTFDFQTVAKELYRITKPGGVVVWIVSDAIIDGSETGTSFRQALYFKDIGFNIHDTMIWCKDGGGGFSNCQCYMQNTEYMFVFSKGRPKAVNLIRDRKNIYAGEIKVGNGRRRANGVFNDENGKVRIVPKYSKRNNWWYFPRAGSYGNHPAAFQEGIARDHILSWSKPGDVVLDPFTGSGTTAKMAYVNKRDFIGFEISKEYCEIAQRRLRETVMEQLTGQK